MVAYIDSHCHLNFAEFAGRRAELFGECDRSGVSHFIVPATGRDNWESVLALHQCYEQVAIAFGLHPYFIASHRDEDVHLLRNALQTHREKVCALGEIGLDRTRPMYDRQKDLFLQQLEVAHELALPVIVHSRKAHSDTLWCLKQAGVRAGVIHAFSGSQQEADAFVDWGMHLGVGAVIAWPRGNKARAVFADVDVRFLLLETDAPDMPVPGQRKGEATPANIPLIFESLSRVRSESPKALRRQLWCNSVALFGLQRWGDYPG